MAYTDLFPVVKNFFESKLVAPCDEVETVIHIDGVQNLPTIIEGCDYIPLVIRDSGVTREVVYVTSIDVDAGTVLVKRAQEQTQSCAWASGTYVYCTVTAGSFQKMRVNSFTPLVGLNGRPPVTRLSSSMISIEGDFSNDVELGMAVRLLSENSVVAPTDTSIGAIHIAGVSFANGVTSLSFQNVDLPGTVSGVDLGLSTASAPMYHPDMVFADEDTLTQEQNVIRISDAFQQFQMDQNAAIQTTADAALPKSGGMMTGQLVHSNVETFIRNSVNTGQTRISGGTEGWSSGGILNCYGVDMDGDYAGGVMFAAMTPGTSGSFAVRLYYDKEDKLFKFTSGGNNVLTSAGGTLTGGLSFSPEFADIKKTTSAGRLVLRGSQNWSTGAHIILGGSTDTTGYAGTVYMHSVTADGPAKVVRLTPDSFTCDNFPVLTLVDSWRNGANWYRKYSDGWIEQGGQVALSLWVEGGYEGSASVGFHIPFVSSEYTVLYAGMGVGISTGHTVERYTTSFVAKIMAHGLWREWTGVQWYACGY